MKMKLLMILTFMLIFSSYSNGQVDNYISNNNQQIEFNIDMNQQEITLETSYETILIPFSNLANSESTEKLKINVMKFNHINGLETSETYDLSNFIYTSDELNEYLSDLQNRYLTLVPNDVYVRSNCGAQQAGVALAVLGLAACSTGVGCGIAGTALTFAIMELINCQQ